MTWFRWLTTRPRGQPSWERGRHCTRTRPSPYATILRPRPRASRPRWSRGLNMPGLLFVRRRETQLQRWMWRRRVHGRRWLHPLLKPNQPCSLSATPATATRQPAATAATLATRHGLGHHTCPLSPSRQPPGELDRSRCSRSYSCNQ